jgi:hypothetical protein
MLAVITDADSQAWPYTYWIRILGAGPRNRPATSPEYADPHWSSRTTGSLENSSPPLPTWYKWLRHHPSVLSCMKPPRSHLSNSLLPSHLYIAFWLFWPWAPSLLKKRLCIPSLTRDSHETEGGQTDGDGQIRGPMLPTLASVIENVDPC